MSREKVPRHEERVRSPPRTPAFVKIARLFYLRQGKEVLDGSMQPCWGGSRERHFPRIWGRSGGSLRPSLRTGRAGFPASGSPISTLLLDGDRWLPKVWSATGSADRSRHSSSASSASDPFRGRGLSACAAYAGCLRKRFRIPASRVLSSCAAACLKAIPPTEDQIDLRHDDDRWFAYSAL